MSREYLMQALLLIVMLVFCIPAFKLWSKTRQKKRR